MEADKGKILQTANQLAAKGQFDRAIAEWKKLLADSPQDGSIHNNIGDLHLKRNATDEAIESYLQAGAAFHATGSALKAIAVYKKILKLDPARYSVYQQLGDLNAERGLVNNAIADYLTLSKLYMRDGRTREALVVYRKIVDLDPTNLAARQRLAELCLQENQRDEAIKAYFRLAKEAVAQEQLDHARKAYEAILKLDPGNAKATKLLKDPKAALQEAGTPVADRDAAASGPLEEAHQQIETGRYEEAERLLSDLLSAQPGDPEVCRLLAMLHLKRGDLAIALSEIQFLSEAAIRAEDYPLAESMIGEYLKIDPGCVGLLELLGSLYEQKGDPAAAAAQYGQAVKALLTNPDPEGPARQAELCDRIKSLDPNSSLLLEIAALTTAASAASVEAVDEGSVGIQEEATPEAVEPRSPFKLVTSDAAESRVDSSTTAQSQHSHPLRLADEGSSSVAPPSETEPGKAAAQSAPLEEASTQEIEGTTTEDATGRAEETAGESVLASAETTVTAAKARTEHEYRLHYELGMAYKHMGMVAEAVEEFRIATEGKECFLEATTMMAASLKEQGLLEPAIECLEQALLDSRCDKEKAISVRYELALLYEADGAEEKASAMFAEIPTFLDARIRMERLQAGGPSDRPHSDAAADVPTTAGAGSGVGNERKKRRISYL